MKFLKYKIKKLINDKINHIRLDYELLLDNKIIKKEFCNSFNGNFLQWLYAGASQGYSYFLVGSSPFNTNDSIKDTSGNNVPATSSHGYFAGYISNNIYTGIILSTDTSIPSVTSYSILGRIDNGAGGGQLTYGAPQGNGISLSGNTATISLFRTFTNNSGADIVVNKFYWLGAGYYKFIEELIQGTTVPNTKSLTIKINLSITT